MKNKENEFMILKRFVREYKKIAKDIKELDYYLQTVTVFDYIFPYCEKHEFMMEIFVECKFNPLMLYAYCKWKLSGKKIKVLKEIIKKLKEKRK